MLNILRFGFKCVDLPGNCISIDRYMHHASATRDLILIMDVNIIGILNALRATEHE